MTAPAAPGGYHRACPVRRRTPPLRSIRRSPFPTSRGPTQPPGGLPKRDDLSRRQRLIVDSSAIADLGLRTMIASIVGAAMLPKVATRRATPGRLPGPSAKRCGSTPNWARRTTQNCRSPRRPNCPGCRRGPPTRSPSGWRTAACTTSSSRAASRRSTPPCASTARGYERNNVVHAQHWVHDDGPHPTLCLIHGFMGSAYLFNGLFFSLPWFYRSGYDVLLYTLAVPRHGAPKGIRPSADTATSLTDSPGSPRRWPRPCTTSVRCWTISSTPGSTGSR